MTACLKQEQEKQTKGNSGLLSELITYLTPVKSLKADALSVSVRATGAIMGCVWVCIQNMELRYWWEYGDEKTRIN